MNELLVWFEGFEYAGLVKWAVGILGSLIGVFGAAIGLRAGLVNLQRQRQAKMIQDQALWAGSVSDFTRDEITASLKYYVVPDCSQTYPANSADIRQSASVRESVMPYVDRFIAQSENRHLLVLADTGMGKTSFCLNFLAHRNKRRAADGSLSCAVVPLGRPNAVEKIKRIPNPAETILLLDAFDEDVMAIQNSSARLRELLDQASEFGTVIITCRSQFFKNDLSVPTRTGVAVVGPRSAGRLSEHMLETIYLLPFTSRQIARYISRYFPWWSWSGFSRSTKAKTLVQDVPELSVRPMLLALLPQLVREGLHVQELFDLYSFMTVSWLRREASWIEPELLTAVSKKLAVYIYSSRARRATDRVSLRELHKIAKALNIPEDKWDHLSARSLLNRDSEGNVKFSHRSIMEFYFVLAAIDGQEKCFKVFWSDFMRELFVSWGNSNEGAGEAERAKQILALDLNDLGLSPLSEPLDRPQSYSRHNFLQNRTHRSRRIAETWRADSLKILSSPGQHRVIHDNEFGLIWEVPHLGDYNSRDIGIVQSTHVELVRSGMDIRLASKAQFLSLLEAEARLDTELLMRGTFLWLGDVLNKRHPIVVSISLKAIEHDGVKLLGPLGAKDRSGVPLWAYEVLTRPVGFAAKLATVSAIPTLVSETDRDTLRRLHLMTPVELKAYLDGLNQQFAAMRETSRNAADAYAG